MSGDALTTLKQVTRIRWLPKSNNDEDMETNLLTSYLSRLCIHSYLMVVVVNTVAEAEITRFELDHDRIEPPTPGARVKPSAFHVVTAPAPKVVPVQHKARNSTALNCLRMSDMSVPDVFRVRIPLVDLYLVAPGVGIGVRAAPPQDTSADLKEDTVEFSNIKRVVSAERALRGTEQMLNKRAKDLNSGLLVRSIHSVPPPIGDPSQHIRRCDSRRVRVTRQKRDTCILDSAGPRRRKDETYRPRRRRRMTMNPHILIRGTFKTIFRRRRTVVVDRKNILETDLTMPLGCLRISEYDRSEDPFNKLIFTLKMITLLRMQELIIDANILLTTYSSENTKYLHPFSSPDPRPTEERELCPSQPQFTSDCAS
ncbi:hypothetical protein EVAR_21924_1 [Eumeta japonica]|uniref:Uncharacterized protein n=1 Tax=Eumeta variegata TaxID=151549 RepID=A0A4C1XHU3_EUMVA|nr:hypothetical protein EVAR_21924_1 [Eumeta japonica]